MLRSSFDFSHRKVGGKNVIIIINLSLILFLIQTIEIIFDIDVIDLLKCITSDAT